MTRPTRHRMGPPPRPNQADRRGGTRQDQETRVGRVRYALSSRSVSQPLTSRAGSNRSRGARGRRRAACGPGRQSRNQLDPHHSPHQCSAREGLRCADRRGRNHQVEGANRHDLSPARLRRPRRGNVSNLAHLRRANRNRQDERAHRHLPRPLRTARAKRASGRGRRVRDRGSSNARRDDDHHHAQRRPGRRHPPSCRARRPTTRVAAADNEAGWQSALARLAALVEGD
jgi:hypothetical protein